MKRPFAVTGFTAFSVMLFLCFCERTDVAYCVLFLSSALGVMTLFNKNLRQALTVPICLFTVVVACLLFLSAENGKLSVQQYAGKDVKVEAVVCEAPYMSKYDRHYCVLSLESLDGEKADGRIRMSFSVSGDGIETDYLQPGNRVAFTGTIYEPGKSEKSISRYFTGENILLGAFGIKDFTFTEPDVKPVGFYFQLLRSYVTKTLRHIFSDRIAGLLVGILTGDRSCLDDELYESFRETGVAHLMAVSGLHLSVWVFFVGSIIPEKGKGVKLKCFLLALAVLFIMFLAGMSESVKRAGFMSLVFILGKFSDRPSDSLNSLGIAVLVMTISNPFSVLSVSFQLSFLSTLGILTLGKVFIGRSAEIFGGKNINTPVRKLLRYCADMFYISISVLVFTFPVLIYSFGGISTVSAWVNILISPVVTPMLLLAGCCVVLSGISFLCYPLSFVTKLVSEYVVFITRSFSLLQNAFLTFEQKNLLLYFVGAVLVFCLCYIFIEKDNRKNTAVSAVGLLISVVLIFANGKVHGEKVELFIEDYGQNVAVAVSKNGSAVILGDMPLYEKGLLVSQLEDKGISVSGTVLSDGKIYLQNEADGKILTIGERIELYNDVVAEKVENSILLQVCEKYICIFSSESLQYDSNCDIIIRLSESDAFVRIGEKNFSMEKEGVLRFTFTDDNFVLRGGNPWLNLMKSN